MAKKLSEVWRDAIPLIAPDARGSALVAVQAVENLEAETAALRARVAELEAEALATTKALALVDMTVQSIEGRDAVRRQTGGNAPELVQGLLDNIGAMWDRIINLEKLAAEHADTLDTLTALRDGVRALVDAFHSIEAGCWNNGCGCCSSERLDKSDEFKTAADAANDLDALLSRTEAAGERGEGEA